MTSFLNRRLKSLIIALTIAASALPLAASAATTQSFQISPPTANYAVDPGGTSRGIVKVTNLTDQPISLNIGQQNFVAKGEEGEIELVDNANPRYSLAPWFTIQEKSLDVPARATKEVHYSINVPANAEPGGRYGTIVFSTVPPRLPSGVSGATVQQNLAGIVFERINGAANEQLDVLSFAPEKSFYEYGPVNLLTRIRNTGNVHEKPTGVITIKNMFGFKVASFALDEHFVIPDSVRRLSNQWPAGSKPSLLVGRYTAELSATYADGKKLSASTSFVVFPWKIALIVALVLLVLFVIGWRGRKRFARAVRILAGKE